MTKLSVSSNFRSLAEVRKAMMLKLQDSSLTETDVKKLQLKPFTAEDVCRRFSDLPYYRAGFQIPYFDLNGKPNCFYRFRYLEYDNGKGFSRLTHSEGIAVKGDTRYAQPRNSDPYAYLPPSMDWRDVSKSTDTVLIITEGELKAACGCKLGLATVGLGGVWSFKSTRNLWTFLPMLKEFQWAGRDVYICYDSDTESNPNVAMAKYQLCHELMLLGAHVLVCRLSPQADGSKTGMDDFLTANGVDAFKKDVLGPAVEFKATEELWRLNSEVIYVRNPGFVLRMDNGQKISPRAFVEHAYSDRIWIDQLPMPQGGVKVVERSAAKEWLKWPQRLTTPAIAVEHSQPQFLPDGRLNLWRGWGVEPWGQIVKERDVQPWLDLRDRVMKGATVENVQWITAWMAYRLQHPSEKQLQGILLWSTEQGTGKNLWTESLYPIINPPPSSSETDTHPYAQTLSETEILQNTRNDWAEGKLLIVVDELSFKVQESYERLKHLITRTHVRIDPKYIPGYNVPDRISYILTTNRSSPLRIEDSDRRLFIHEVTSDVLSQEEADTFVQFMTDDGLRKVFRYLLDFDCSKAGYNPKMRAPDTGSKRRMVAESASDVVGWAMAIRDAPDETLVSCTYPVPFSLFRGQELISLYRERYPNSREQDTIIYSALRRAGFRQVMESEAGVGQVRVNGWGKLRLWAVRRVEELSKLKEKQLAGEFLKERGAVTPEQRTALATKFRAPSKPARF